MRAFWHLFTLTGHADLLKCQLSVSCGSGEVCHSSRGSPYSRGCTLNSKPMWSISRPRPQRLIWLMVDFCSHSDAHHLSVLDSEHTCFQKDILERYVCFPLERTPSKIVLSLMASQTCSCYKIHSGIIPLNLYVSHFFWSRMDFICLEAKLLSGVSQVVAPIPASPANFTQFSHFEHQWETPAVCTVGVQTLLS